MRSFLAIASAAPAEVHKDVCGFCRCHLWCSYSTSTRPYSAAKTTVKAFGKMAPSTFVVTSVSGLSPCLRNCRSALFSPSTIALADSVPANSLRNGGVLLVGGGSTRPMVDSSWTFLANQSVRDPSHPLRAILLSELLF